jgi:threonine dehydrogenase-like Zn-dependent dehydrogenase
MKAFCKMEDGSLQFCQIEEPYVVSPDDVKIKIKYNTICSDDIRIDQEGDYFSREGILGHEMCGVIVDLGEQAKIDGFSIGDKVSGLPVCYCGRCSLCKKQKYHCCLELKVTTGTICEYVVWKSRQIVKLGDEISYKVGCLIEPVAAVLEAVEKINISFGDSVAIFGAGFTGLMFIKLAKMKGATNITVIEPLSYRRELAKQYGADHVLDYNDKYLKVKTIKLTDFIGFDVIIETTANSQVVEDALGVIAKGGTLLLFGQYGVNQKFSVNALQMYGNNITICSSFLSNSKLEVAAKILSRLPVDELLTIEFPFEKAIEAFQMEKMYKHIKIAIKIS